MRSAAKRLAIFVLFFVSPLLAGTRLFHELDETLRMNRNCAVLEAKVVRVDFQSLETSDVVLVEVEPSNLHRKGDLDSQPGPSLRFSAYRPPPSKDGKHRSVYSWGSGLEFGLEEGKTYLFLCPSEHSLVRVEEVEELDTILEFLASFDSPGPSD